MTDKIATGISSPRLTGQAFVVLKASFARLSAAFSANTGISISKQVMISVEKSPRVNTVRNVFWNRRQSIAGVGSEKPVRIKPTSSDYQYTQQKRLRVAAAIRR